MTTEYERKLLEAMTEWGSNEPEFGSLLAKATSPYHSQLRVNARRAISLLPHGKEILREETRK